MQSTALFKKLNNLFVYIVWICFKDQFRQGAAAKSGSFLEFNIYLFYTDFEKTDCINEL